MKLLRFLNDSIWIVVPLLSAMALGLGLHGSAADDPQGSTWDHLYRAIALFVIEDGGQANMTWSLNVARFMAPLALALAAILAFLNIFGARLERFLLRFQSDHVVLCGLGAGALQLARDFKQRQPGRGLLIIDNGQAGDLLAEAEAERIPVLHGSAHGTELLKTAGVPRARHMVLLCDEDDDNIQGAAEVYRIHKASWQGTGSTLELALRIHDDALRARFMEHKIFLDQEDAVEVKVFSTPETIARLLLQQHPLEITPAGKQAERVHLVVIGFGGLGQAVAREALFAGHYANLRKLKLTVIDRDLRDAEERFRYRHPGLDKVAETEFITCEVNCASFDRLKFLAQPSPAGEKLTIAICLGGDVLNFSTALKASSLLRAAGSSDHAKLLFKARDNRGVAQLLKIHADAVSAQLPPLLPFGMAEDECNYQNVIAPGREEIARTMHTKYFDNFISRGKKAGAWASLVPWPELPAHLQDSNRWQYEHLSVKIRLVDPRFADPGFAGNDLAQYAAKVSSMEFQEMVAPHKSTMSRMEHERWSAEKWLTGWEYAAKRDDNNKLHPDLVPYDELAKDIQQLDANTVENMTDWLDILRGQNH